MTEDMEKILTAWNRFMVIRGRQANKNEGSSAQHEDYRRIFKEGIVGHPKLSKKQKHELLVHIGAAPPS